VIFLSFLFIHYSWLYCVSLSGGNPEISFSRGRIVDEENLCWLLMPRFGWHVLSVVTCSSLFYCSAYLYSQGLSCNRTWSLDNRIQGIRCFCL
jgi:hypothetical protein